MKRSRPKRKKYDPQAAEDWQAIRADVMVRDMGICRAAIIPGCRGRGSHVHHRKLRSQGGKDELDNLILLCEWCHEYIHKNPAESYEVGWLVRGAGIEQ